MTTYEVIHGDSLAVLESGGIPADAAIVSDPPYGMGWDTDSTRFTGGSIAIERHSRLASRGDIVNDDTPFDPSPWLPFPFVSLWGANHYGQRLPVGTTLVWVKRKDYAYGSFLSDAEIGWEKGGHGVYCFTLPRSPYRDVGQHPTQKPVQLMRWCIERLGLPEGALVVDPFCGSGSTGVAAVQMGYRFLGIELDPAHVATARRRIQAAHDQLTLL